MIAAGIIIGPGTIKIAKTPDEINDKIRFPAINSRLKRLINKNTKKIEYIIKIPVGYLLLRNILLTLLLINPPFLFQYLTLIFSVSSSSTVLIFSKG